MDRFFNIPGLNGLLSNRFFMPLVLSTFAVAYIYRNKKQLKELEKKIKPSVNDDDEQSGCCQDTCGNFTCKTVDGTGSCGNLIDDPPHVIFILYATLTGTAKSLASSFYDKIKQIDGKFGNIKPILADVTDFDFKKALESNGITNVCETTMILFVSTHDGGKPPESAEKFINSVKMGDYDSEMRKLSFSIFGLGNSVYGENFNKVAKDLSSLFIEHGATKIHGNYLFDEDNEDDINGAVNSWSNEILSGLVILIQSKKSSSWIDEIDQEVLFSKDDYWIGNDKKQQDDGIKNNGNDKGEDNDDYDSDDSDEDEEKKKNDIGDIEDLVPSMGKGDKDTGDIKEMTNEIIRKNLKKQGYKLVGSHSAVKMCRWTKSMLRGRGGCYKHTFYGIESHRCMETTPSLACANKCVFCWRHHTNPVGTEWKWKMNEPDFIVEEIIKNHVKMINEFKGVPGVIPERIEEGFKVRHCALSLVGEPIMYPKINELLKLLHKKGISTFLVTNAQFPEEIRNLTPVTQLYVSVDASTPESLKRIDRPLFKNSWDRFIFSLEALHHKKIRTVYRLTLVKEWNTEEIENYADLVVTGNPDFIEIKGVTFCGTSKASKITMENVPWHEEVVKFGQALAAEIDHNWEIVSEHEHSNCILIAQKRFKINDKWHTWIDFDKYLELVQRYYDTDGEVDFDALDYALETPEWALFGSKERGFDPEEKRFHRNNKD